MLFVSERRKTASGLSPRILGAARYFFNMLILNDNKRSIEMEERDLSREIKACVEGLFGTLMRFAIMPQYCG